MDPLPVLHIGTGLNTEGRSRLNTTSFRGGQTRRARASTHLMTSPSRTLRLLRTTLFMRTFSSEQVSSDSTMHTVSRLFFPFISTVSPRKSWSSSILVWTQGRLFHTLTGTHSQRTLLKFYLGERDHAVVLVDGFIYDESVGSVLLFQDRSGQVVIFRSARRKLESVTVMVTVHDRVLVAGAKTHSKSGDLRKMHKMDGSPD